jgi:hypothetical protein
MTQWLFYGGIAAILIRVIREVYQSWRRDREAREWVIKHEWRDGR